eukprot:10172152-Alexandrium_andersonii.AAC.1
MLAWARLMATSPANGQLCPSNYYRDQQRHLATTGEGRFFGFGANQAQHQNAPAPPLGGGQEAEHERERAQ